MKCNLEPRRPQNAKEPNVRYQIVAICDRMIGGERSEIGDEEQVEKELDGVRFVALRENEVFVISARQRVFDPGHGLVQAFEMLFLVAASG